MVKPEDMINGFTDVIRTRDYKDDSEITVTWDSGRVTKHPKTLMEDHACKTCGETIHHDEDKIQFDGDCRNCYVKENHDVPGKIKTNLYYSDYYWIGQIKDTAIRHAFPNYELQGDLKGNDFGVGDFVISKDDKQVKNKGVVTDMHLYDQYPYNFGNAHQGMVLARVNFGVCFDDMPSSRLIALTDSHVDYSHIKKLPPLEDIPIKSDPMKSEHKEAFNDPVARAIWMTYVRNHLIFDHEGINKASLTIAKEIKDKKISPDEMRIWFRDRFVELSNLNIEKEYVLLLAPYLSGEKVATYKIVG